MQPISPVDRAVRVILTVANLISWYCVSRALLMDKPYDGANGSGRRTNQNVVDDELEIIRSNQIIKKGGHTINVDVAAVVKKTRH